jgi:hypothetical protein
MKEMTVLGAHPAPVMAQAMDRWQGVLQGRQGKWQGRQQMKNHHHHHHHHQAKIVKQHVPFNLQQHSLPMGT